MKFKKEYFGMYPIIILLVLYLLSFLFQLIFHVYSTNLLLRIVYSYGALPFVFIVLVVAALISVFVNYKFNWIVVSLPFLYKLLLPLKHITPDNYSGMLINAFYSLIISDVTGFFLMLFSALLPLAMVVYLFVKNTKKIENKKFEIISVVAMIVLYLINLVF